MSKVSLKTIQSYKYDLNFDNDKGIATVFCIGTNEVIEQFNICRNPVVGKSYLLFCLSGALRDVTVVSIIDKDSVKVCNTNCYPPKHSWEVDNRWTNWMLEKN